MRAALAVGMRGSGAADALPLAGDSPAALDATADCDASTFLDTRAASFDGRLVLPALDTFDIPGRLVAAAMPRRKTTAARSGAGATALDMWTEGAFACGPGIFDTARSTMRFVGAGVVGAPTARFTLAGADVGDGSCLETSGIRASTSATAAGSVERDADCTACAIGCAANGGALPAASLEDHADPAPLAGKRASLAGSGFSDAIDTSCATVVAARRMIGASAMRVTYGVVGSPCVCRAITAS